MSTFSQTKSSALLELLQYAHGESYIGTDDDMSDRCDAWIANLTEQEVMEIARDTFRKGL